MQADVAICACSLRVGSMLCGIMHALDRAVCDVIVGIDCHTCAMTYCTFWVLPFYRAFDILLCRILPFRLHASCPHPGVLTYELCRPLCVSGVPCSQVVDTAVLAPGAQTTPGDVGMSECVENGLPFHLCMKLCDVITFYFGYLNISTISKRFSL